MSYPKTIIATGQVFEGIGELCAVNLAAGGVAATLVIYDGTDNTGQVLARIKAAANTSNAIPDLEVSFYKGIYAEISGTGAAAEAYL